MTALYNKCWFKRGVQSGLCNDNAYSDDPGTSLQLPALLFLMSSE